MSDDPSKIEEILDFTNYRIHPTQKGYLVYHFSRADQAGFFENLLIEHKIAYERYDDTKANGKVYYFAIKKRLEKTIEKLNNLAIGQYRNKFIPNYTMRWVVIAIGVVSITLSIIGYLKTH